jgi:hypothetical protein
MKGNFQWELGGRQHLAAFAPLLVLQCGRRGAKARTSKAARAGHDGGAPGANTTIRIIMDDSVQKSCWGVTAKAIAGFAFVILVAWLIGGAETAVIATTG